MDLLHDLCQRCVTGFLSLLGSISLKVKGKVHTCTGTEALYRPYGP